MYILISNDQTNITDIVNKFNNQKFEMHN